jgi:hypothetical protein
MTDHLKHPALSQIETKRDDVYAFEIDGHISKDEINRVFQTLEEAYQEHDKINLLVRVGRYDGFDWSTVFSEATYIGKLHALRHLRRYALIGGPGWFGNATSFFGPLFRIEIRHFELDDEATAWNWIYENGEENTEAA